MKRNVEPEVVAAEDQARAYAQADSETAHSSYPKLNRGASKSKSLSVMNLGLSTTALCVGAHMTGNLAYLSGSGQENQAVYVTHTALNSFGVRFGVRDMRSLEQLFVMDTS